MAGRIDRLILKPVVWKMVDTNKSIKIYLSMFRKEEGKIIEISAAIPTRTLRQKILREALWRGIDAALKDNQAELEAMGSFVVAADDGTLVLEDSEKRQKSTRPSAPKSAVPPAPRVPPPQPSISSPIEATQAPQNSTSTVAPSSSESEEVVDLGSTTEEPPQKREFKRLMF